MSEAGMRRVVFRDAEISLNEPLPFRCLDGIKAYRCVCPGCGEIWATVESAKTGTYFFPNLPCERCPKTCRIFSTPCGSIRLIFKWWFESWEKDPAKFLRLFPRKLIEREVLLLAEQRLEALPSKQGF